MRAIAAYTVRGIDGNDVTISQTHEGTEVVISIRQEGKISTVRLTKDQLDAFFDTRYKTLFFKEEE